MRYDWKTTIIGGCLPMLFASSCLWAITGSREVFSLRYWVFYAVFFGLTLWAYALGSGRGFNKGWEDRERKMRREAVNPPSSSDLPPSPP